MALTKVTGQGLETLSDGVTITTADNTAQLTLTSTDTDANAGPHLKLYRNATGADSDALGQVEFTGKDDAGNDFIFAQIESYISDASNGAEAGYLEIFRGVGGTERVSGMVLAPTETVFNDNSGDIDLRVESNGNANMLFVDGATDKVGVGRAAPASVFEVHMATNKNIGFSGAQGELSSIPALVAYNDAGALAEIGFRGTTIRFATAAAEGMRLDTNNNFMVGGTSNDPIASGSSNLAVTSGFININKANNIAAYVGRSGSDGAVVAFYKGTSNVGLINVNGSSTAYATSSDYRLKENVDYTWDATTRLKQLKPARFNFIADESNTLVDGFLAHEVSSIVPEAITGTKDAMTTEVLYVDGDELPDGKSVGDVKQASVPDMQGIDQSKLVPLLVKTIQELEARITALEA